MFPVLAESEAYSFGEALLIFEYADEEQIDVVVLEVPTEGVFVHLIGHASDEDLQVVLVLHRVFLPFPQLPILLAFGVLQYWQLSAFLQVDALVLRPVLPQFLSHYFRQVLQLLRDVEYNTFLVFVLLHALYGFVEVLGELFT